jgi:hypothetical protein
MVPTLSNVEMLKIRKLELITVGVKCSQCGHTWGIRLNGKTDLSQVPFNFLICENCIRIANSEPREGVLTAEAH